jgi:hypothetical protein
MSSFVKEVDTKKEDEELKRLQEQKLKKIEEDNRIRAQQVKKHKPVENVNIPVDENAKNQSALMIKVSMINNILITIATKNYPAIEDVSNIDPKFLDAIDVPLADIVNLITKTIQIEFEAAKRSFGETEQKYYANEIFLCLRELNLFGFITTIDNTEQGIKVKINPKSLSYLNAIAYLVPQNDYRNQYALYHTLWNAQ